MRLRVVTVAAAAAILAIALAPGSGQAKKAVACPKAATKIIRKYELTHHQVGELRKEVDKLLRKYHCTILNL